MVGRGPSSSSRVSVPLFSKSPAHPEKAVLFEVVDHTFVFERARSHMRGNSFQFERDPSFNPRTFPRRGPNGQAGARPTQRAS